MWIVYASSWTFTVLKMAYMRVRKQSLVLSNCIFPNMVESFSIEFMNDSSSFVYGAIHNTLKGFWIWTSCGETPCKPFGIYRFCHSYQFWLADVVTGVQRIDNFCVLRRRLMNNCWCIAISQSFTVQGKYVKMIFRRDVEFYVFSSGNLCTPY